MEDLVPAARHDDMIDASALAMKVRPQVATDQDASLRPFDGPEVRFAGRLARFNPNGPTAVAQPPAPPPMNTQPMNEEDGA